MAQRGDKGRAGAARPGSALGCGGGARAPRPAARRVARPAPALRTHPAHAGQRDQPDHRRHARLLRQRRGRPRASGGTADATPTHNYRDVAGGIPIPATLSIELGKRISAHDGSVKYRFVSDLPFKRTRAARARRFRAAMRSPRCGPTRSSRSSRFPARSLDRNVRMAAPVVMGAGLRHLPQLAIPTARSTTGRSATCAASRRSPSRSRSPRTSSSFKYLLTYFALAAAAGITFILLQRRQAALIRGMNRELGEANDFLAGDLDEDRQIPLAADLQEHLQRPEGRRRSRPSARSSPSSSPTSRTSRRSRSGCSRRT